MDATCAIDPKEIHRLVLPPGASRALLEKSAWQARIWVARVENEWESFSLEARELLTAFAYSMIPEPRDIRLRLKALWGRMRLAYTLVRGREEMLAVAEYVHTMDRLVDAILSAVEREDEVLQSKIAVAVEEAMREA